MHQTKKYHYYSFPELLGHLMVLVVIIVSIAGGLRLVELLLPIDGHVAIPLVQTTTPIASVSEYLQAGYLKIETVQSSALVSPL